LTLIRMSIAVLLAGAVMAFSGVDAVGQESSPREMIHAYRVWKLTEVLDLSDETMPLFFSRLKELEKKEAELVRQEQKGIREIAELLGEEQANQEDLRRALDRYETSRANLMEEIRNLRREAVSLLDTRQRCEYVVFEHGFRAELRDMIERARALRSGQIDRTGTGDDMGRPDPGGRGVGGGAPGGSGRGRR
jgi:hypothetical protein